MEHLKQYDYTQFVSVKDLLSEPIYEEDICELPVQIELTQKSTFPTHSVKLHQTNGFTIKLKTPVLVAGTYVVDLGFDVVGLVYPNYKTKLSCYQLIVLEQLHTGIVRPHVESTSLHAMVYLTPADQVAHVIVRCFDTQANETEIPQENKCIDLTNGCYIFKHHSGYLYKVCPKVIHEGDCFVAVFWYNITRDSDSCSSISLGDEDSDDGALIESREITDEYVVKLNVRVSS